MPTEPSAEDRLTLDVRKRGRKYEVTMTLHRPGLWLNRRTALSVRRAVEKMLPVIAKGGSYGV